MNHNLPLRWSRYTALLFAIGLAIGEAVKNWGDWQYAPLWIVDYICVAWLIAGFFQTRQGENIAALIGGWAFTAGVFYMALFVWLDLPRSGKCDLKQDDTQLLLIGIMLALAALGLVTATLALRRSTR